MKAWIAALALAVCCVGGVAQAQDNLTPEQIRTIAHSVVMIQNLARNGQPQSQGSGTIINAHGQIITNRHVTEDGAAWFTPPSPAIDQPFAD